MVSREKSSASVRRYTTRSSSVASLAKARVPIFIIHGDADTVVPLKENSAELLRRYELEDAGASVKLVVAKDQGHNYWEGFFRCQNWWTSPSNERAGAKEKSNPKNP